MHFPHHSHDTHARSRRSPLLAATSAIVAIVVLSLGVNAVGSPATPKVALEEIYILHSIREPREPVTDWCSSAKTGFAPFPADAERFYSFWSTRSEAGKVVDAKVARVAELRGCFGPTSEPARQNFYAEIKLGAVEVHGSGECQALRVDVPETGLYPVRCQIVLTGTSGPYVGGLLTTNTVTSKAAYGADTNPLGYTQASIATIRLWKAR